jgi:predicted aspartyl protease
MSKKFSTRIPLEILSIDDGWHICLPVRINELYTRMLLDTGASRTVLDIHHTNLYSSESPEIIENKLSAGLGTTEMQSYRLTIGKLNLGRYTIEDYECICLDLNVLNKSYEMLGMEKVAGIIGTDILLRFNASINLSKRMLTLHSENTNI